jgi:hypothetical protein
MRSRSGAVGGGVMTKTEICRKLHDMVDQLHDMPDAFWDGVYPTIRLGFKRDSDGDELTLIVGAQQGNDE